MKEKTSQFVVAAMQVGSEPSKLETNIERHCKAIAAVSEFHDVDLAVFPELSLTGYEPESAHGSSIAKDDDRLRQLSCCASQFNVAILAGCPIENKSNDKPFIGSLLFLPNRDPIVYCKRHLDSDEQQCFASSNNPPLVFELKNHKIGVAICYEIHIESHIQELVDQKIDVLATSVFMTPTGINSAYHQLFEFAKKFRLVSIMANHASNSSSHVTAGSSAAWDPKHLIASAKPSGGAAVVVAKQVDRWMKIEVCDLEVCETTQ